MSVPSPRKVKPSPRGWLVRLDYPDSFSLGPYPSAEREPEAAAAEVIVLRSRGYFPSRVVVHRREAVS